MNTTAETSNEINLLRVCSIFLKINHVAINNTVNGKRLITETKPDIK